MKKTLLLSIIAFVCVSVSGIARQKVETYNYPEGQTITAEGTTEPKVIRSSELYDVNVEGQRQFVLVTGADRSDVDRIHPPVDPLSYNGIDNPNICAFGCSGKVNVEISLNNCGIESFEVMPVSKKPVHSIRKGKLYVQMKPRDRYIVKINGNEKNLLLLFANPLQSEMGVSEDDPNVIRFKAGKVYNDVTIMPRNGQTVFIEGGAIVMGHIEAKNVSCHINGPGVLNCYPEKGKGVYLYKCHDSSLQNLIVLNKASWATAVCTCSNIKIDNWHAISTYSPYDKAGVNNDTCDLFGSNTVTITNGFSYCHDDAFCIKSHKFAWKGEVYDVSYDDCISYAVDGGNGIDLGYELNENVRYLSYKNMYIVRSNGTRGEMRRGAIALHNAAEGTVDGVTYENVYIEDPREFGFHMAVLESEYSLGTDPVTTQNLYWTKPGHVKNVKVKNLHILKTPPYGYYISGYDENHRFGIEFDGLYIGGKKVKSLEAFKRLPNVTIQHADVIIR